MKGAPCNCSPFVHYICWLWLMLSLVAVFVEGVSESLCGIWYCSWRLQPDEGSLHLLQLNTRVLQHWHSLSNQQEKFIRLALCYLQREAELRWSHEWKTGHEGMGDRGWEGEWKKVTVWRVQWAYDRRLGQTGGMCATEDLMTDRRHIFSDPNYQRCFFPPANPWHIGWPLVCTVEICFSSPVKSNGWWLSSAGQDVTDLLWSQ